MLTFVWIIVELFAKGSSKFFKLLKPPRIIVSTHGTPIYTNSQETKTPDLVIFLLICLSKRHSVVTGNDAGEFFYIGITRQIAVVSVKFTLKGINMVQAVAADTIKTKRKPICKHIKYKREIIPGRLVPIPHRKISP